MYIVHIKIRQTSSVLLFPLLPCHNHTNDVGKIPPTSHFKLFCHVPYLLLSPEIQENRWQRCRNVGYTVVDVCQQQNKPSLRHCNRFSC